MSYALKVMYKAAMINHVFTSFSAIEIYGPSFIHSEMNALNGSFSAIRSGHALLAGALNTPRFLFFRKTQ